MVGLQLELGNGRHGRGHLHKKTTQSSVIGNRKQIVRHDSVDVPDLMSKDKPILMLKSRQES